MSSEDTPRQAGQPAASGPPPVVPLLTLPFALTCLTGFMLFTSFMLLLGVLPLYLKDDLGGSDATVGLIIGVFAFAALFPRPFIGREIDRSGSKRFLVAGAVIFVTSSLLYFVADSIPALLGVRVWHGIGMACFHTAAFTFIAELAPVHRRGEAMGIWGMMSTFATAIGPFAGLTIRENVGDSAVFMTSAICAGASLLIISFVREPRREDAPASGATGGLFEPSVVPPAILALAVTLVYGTVSSFILLYADEQGIERKGLYFTVFAGAVLMARLFGGRISDQRGRWAVIMPSFVLTICAMLVLSVTSNLALLLLTGALFGLAFGAGNPAMTALAIDLVRPDRRGAGMATYTSAFELGIGSGSIVMGLVAAGVGYSAMFLICAIFPTLAIVYSLGQMRARAPLPERAR